MFDLHPPCRPETGLDEADGARPGAVESNIATPRFHHTTWDLAHGPPMLTEEMTATVAE